MTRAIKPIERHVGGRVRMRRVLLGMSQGQLGKSLGVTFQQIQKYEKGQNRIGASRLQQIGKLLEVPVSYFFEGAPPDAEPAASGFSESGENTYALDFAATREGVQLVRAFMRIEDVKVRKRVLDLIESMAPPGAEAEPETAVSRKRGRPPA
jgi:transcriptional regulator with XRE-family HTH domain